MTSRSQPIFNVPAPVVVILAVLVAVHLVRMVFGPAMDEVALVRFAFVPVRASDLVDHAGVMARLAAWSESADPDLVRDHALALAFLTVSTGDVLLSFLSYAFLHGDWTHLGFNAFWLLAFGSPVARRLGPLRFCALLAVAAVAGAAAHWLCFPFGADPVIGASAAVSGCMGAATRFVFAASPLHEGPSPPAESLMVTLRDRRALSFVVVWFLSNAVFGASALSFGFTQAPVAWQAHIGGFLVGLLAFRLFDRRAPPHTVMPEDIAGDAAPPAL